MGINFHELKTTIFRENKLSRILENRIFRGIKLSRICQNSRKSRKFLPHYFLPLKYIWHSCRFFIYRLRSYVQRLETREVNNLVPSTSTKFYLLPHSNLIYSGNRIFAQISHFPTNKIVAQMWNGVRWKLR